ncbi:MAG TPA: hypothetical protein VG370_08105 [Chloroflexota bacterium]|nr:hypothetical protein [Chloroflexota bacterium]
MHRRRFWRSTDPLGAFRATLALAAMLLALGPMTGGAQSAPAPRSGNLLHNPSFEGGMYHASMSNFIAEGWSYWYQARSPDDPRGYWLPEPEYGLIANRPGQMRSGAKSQRWFNTWAIHNAGLYQTVSVPANAWLRFTIWMFNWSSQADVFGVSDGFHRKWVGIDPTGGTDPFSANIVWGNEDRTMDLWVQLGVVARARGDRVTVFVREQPEWAVKHNDVLLDDAELVAVAPPSAEVVQPVAAGTRPGPGDNGTPDRAFPLSALPTVASLAGSPSGSYAYFTVDYPGGGRPYTINVQATPSDARILSKVRFRIYHPSSGHVVAESGYVHSGRPNVLGDLIRPEPGRYLVQLTNENAGESVDYRIWLSGPGVVAEAPAVFARPAQGDGAAAASGGGG